MKKIALVTGASRGIGEQIALHLAKQGCHLVLCCKERLDLLQEVQRKAENCGVTCIGFGLDISKEEEVKSMAENLLHRYGQIDAIINNAGISHVGLLQDMTLAEWNQILAVNLTSLFLTTKYLLPSMLRHGEGNIINISSVWGNTGASMETAYSAAKGGVNAFTKALAKELAPSRIRVNAIAAGFIDTSMNHHLSPAERTALQEEIPLGRFGTPGDVAKTVDLILKSPYLTGQIITLDGGWT